jgi:hypothetical protein
MTDFDYSPKETHCFFCKEPCYGESVCRVCAEEALADEETIEQKEKRSVENDAKEV